MTVDLTSEAPKRRGIFVPLPSITLPAFLPKYLSLSKERSYFGLRRDVFLMVFLGGALALLALALGLAIGLTVGRKSSKQYIPNPSNNVLNTGEATYYEPGLGACGVTSLSTDAIVAVSHVVWDAAQVGANPNTNPLCGRKLWATRVREETGRNASVEATVVDRCTGCKPEDLDFSISIFEVLAAEGLGRVSISWAWV